MRTPFVAGVGGVLSADIAVPHHEQELRFYAQVLTTGPSPLWWADLMNSRGAPVIGLGERVPAYEALPVQWMPHIQVADVGVGVAGARAAGGQVLMHAIGDDGSYSWAVVADPAGATFGLIPVVDEAAVADAPLDRTGHIAWLTLVAPEVAVARTFYEKVVGWTALADGDGGFDMQRPGGIAASIRPRAGAYASVRPAWLLHLPVDDLAESLRRVGEGGGTVVSGSAEAGVAVICDPVGVYLALQAV